MADSVFRRIWDTIKPLASAPRSEWQPAAPPAWRRMWDAIKPLAPVFAYIKSAPMRAESAIREGVGIAAAGDESAAIERFNRAIAMRPDFAAAYLRRRSSRQGLRQTDAAVADPARALQLDPGLAAAHIAMGLVYRDQGHGDRAIAEFTAALTLLPNDAYYQRGPVYESLGQHERVIEDYNAAIGSMPNPPYGYRARATSELNLGDRDAASRDRNLALASEHSGGEDSP
jgi:tetratricopeptide (TPR) repeat protein